MLRSIDRKRLTGNFYLPPNCRVVDEICEQFTVILPNMENKMTTQTTTSPWITIKLHYGSCDGDTRNSYFALKNRETGVLASVKDSRLSAEQVGGAALNNAMLVFFTKEAAKKFEQEGGISS